LLDEARAIEEARIARNAQAGSWLPYKPGWTEVRDREIPKLKLYRLALDEFETPDDRPHPAPFICAKDYSDASEGTGRVAIRSSNYDIEESEVFSPYDATIIYQNSDGWKCKRRATADEENTLGLDGESDLVEKMTDAVKAWAGMTTPPPKAADPTVKILIEKYLANGGQIHTCDAYQTTPRSKIRFKANASIAWGAGKTVETGIPPELRKKKKLFMVRPKTGSKLWSNTV
jgi:hypothetical protein